MINSLQLFRFIAFLAIFSMHAQGYIWFKFYDTSVSMAVSFFIVLSGFLVGLKRVDVSSMPRIKDCLSYLWGKVKKFYTLHLILLLISALYFKNGIVRIFVMESPIDLKDFVCLFLRNLFLVQSWFDSQYFSFNGVSWFLSTILFLYLVAPWLRWGLIKISKERVPILLVIIVLFFAANCAYCYILHVHAANMGFWTYIFPPSRLQEFAAGICLGILLSNRLQWKRITPLSFLSMSLVELITIYLVIKCGTGKWSLCAWGTRTTNYFLVNLLLIGVFSFQKGIVSRLISNKLSLVLGLLTMPAFLIHQVIIKCVAIYFFRTNVAACEKYIPFLLCLALTIIFSFIVARKEIFTKLKDKDPITGKIKIATSTYLLIATCFLIFVAGLVLLSPLRKGWVEVKFKLADAQVWDTKNCSFVQLYYASAEEPRYADNRKRFVLVGTPLPEKWYSVYVPSGTNKFRLDFIQKIKSKETDLRFPIIEELYVGEQRQNVNMLKRKMYKDPTFEYEW